MSVAYQSSNQAVAKSASSLKSKTNDDEFMAAAIGDVDWLKQSVRSAKQHPVNLDKNVSTIAIKLIMLTNAISGLFFISLSTVLLYCRDLELCIWQLFMDG